MSTKNAEKHTSHTSHKSSHDAERPAPPPPEPPHPKVPEAEETPASEEAMTPDELEKEKHELEAAHPFDPNAPLEPGEVQPERASGVTPEQKAQHAAS